MSTFTEEELRATATALDLDPLRWYRPAKKAEQFLTSAARFRLLRGPNQAGKTMSLCADAVDFVLGRGRWNGDRPIQHPPPVQVWFVCASWKNSLVVQQKFHELLPRGEMAPGQTYSDRTGFGGAAVALRNRGLVRFVTTNQDETSLESATLDGAWVDEIPTEAIWSTLCARVRNRNGPITLGFTPLGRGMEWIKKLVDSGVVEEHHYALDLEAVWPVGAIRPFLTQAQIDAFVAVTPSQLRAQRVGGAWDGPPQDPSFRDFEAAKHIRSERPTGLHWKVGIGVDHATQPGKQAIALVAVEGGYSISPRIAFLDEAQAPKDTSWGMAQVADAIIELLKRNHLRYEDVDAWAGDRPAQNKYGSKQSNILLRGHIAAKLGLPEPKAIKTPNKGPGSVDYVCSLINDRFQSGAAWVSPNCPRLIEFFEQFDGNPHHATKDIGDAARYAVMALIAPKWYNGSTPSKGTQP